MSTLPRLRHRALLGAAAAHLVLVASSALHPDLAAQGPLGRGAATYAAVSGADTAYGFFAPEVDAQLRASFEVRRADGRIEPDELGTGASAEGAFRIRNLAGAVREGGEGWRRALAASMAGHVLGKHPDAESVLVRFESYDLPCMAATRRGARPGWTLHYEARFAPRARRR
jgi:hypothetical protein